jgi:DNA-binding MarR family transcriptional regulator
VSAETRRAITFQDYWMRPGNLLRRLHRLSLAVFAEESASCEISRSQFEALTAIARFPGLDQISLARAFGIDRSTTALVLKVLTDRGLVHRTVHPEDRRRRVLELTDAGLTMHDVALLAARRTEQRLMRPLSSDEVEEFVTALRTIITDTPSGAPAWTLEAHPSPDQARAHVEYLGQRPGFLLRRCWQVFHALFGEATQDLDITATQYGLIVLLNLIQADEAATARLVGVERSTGDRLLQRLKARGYIEKATNRQHAVLRATTEGRALLEQVHRRAETADITLLSSLAPEARDALTDTMARLLFAHT